MEENNENVVKNENTPAEKSNKKNKVPMIICLVGVLLIMAVAIFVLLSKGGAEEKENQQSGNNKPEESEKIEEVTLSEEEAEKLISYVPVSFPYSKDNDYTAFTDKKTIVSEMDSKWLIYNAMNKVENKGNNCNVDLNIINGLCDFTLTKSQVTESIKNLYGDISLELPKEINDNFLWHCTLVDDLYACSNTGGGYATTAVTSYFGIHVPKRQFTRTLKAEKDNSHLYIYVKYAKLEMVYDENNDNIQPGDITFRIRKYGTGNEVIDETILSGTDYYEDNASKTFYDKLYEQFGDKMTTYKITYNITSEGTYNLSSVEPVK